MVHKICFPSHQSPAYRYPVLETCLTVLTCFALLGCGASSDPVDDQCELGGSILVEEGVSQDTLWDCTVAPYQVMSEFNVSAAATLTIAPGVTVEFGEDGSLVIGAEDEHGSLSAVGTADEPILFTSSAAVPAAGDWKAIVIHSGANSATIEHAIIEYGGASFNVPDYGCCTEAALLVNNSAVTLRNTIFADNVSGVLFKNGGSAVAFSDNSFSGHSEWPVQIEASQVGTLTGPNTFDSDDVVAVAGGIVSSDATWNNLGAPYEVLESVQVQDDSAPTLTIAPGVSMYFAEDAYLSVGDEAQGSLMVVGTAEAPILFSSAKAVQGPGDWQGLLVNLDAIAATFEYVHVEYAGQSFNVPNSGCCAETSLLVRDGDVAITNSSFSNGVDGVRFHEDGSATAFHDNVFTELSGAAVAGTPEAIGTLSSPNTFDSDDVVAVAGGIVSSDATWSALGAPYRLDGRVQVKGSAAPTLTIAAGVTLKMGEDTALEIGAEEQGALIADGSVAPITFTSSRESPAAGDWEAVGIYGATTEATFRSVIFEYGGASYNAPTWGCCAESLLFARSAAVTVEDSVFRNSAGHGIELGETASLTQSGNSFTDLVGEDVMQH